jgi:hypothetical protein
MAVGFLNPAGEGEGVESEFGMGVNKMDDPHFFCRKLSSAQKSSQIFSSFGPKTWSNRNGLR